MRRTPRGSRPSGVPYHLEALSGSEVLIGDAAGNTLLSAKTNGDVDWVALFRPPVDQNGEWLVLFTEGDVTCYVQPVPTSVTIGPDGAYYVGELTGEAVDPADAFGLARVWRIEPGARNVVCPSADCQEVVSGLTSVIDLAFGPDGKLWVVEFDQNGWLAALIGSGAGGAIKSCDVGTGTCQVVEDGLVLPGAITFDKWATSGFSRIRSPRRSTGSLHHDVALETCGPPKQRPRVATGVAASKE